jgi:cytidine deaminase
MTRLDDLNELDLDVLAKAAWSVRDNARVLGKTRVGCAARSSNGEVWVGCNVEHRFRSHDIHAEVNAISSMVAGGQQRLVTVAIAAQRERFTPCGACLDWIFEFGGPECVVAVQNERKLEVLTAHELMPHYPR